MKYGFHWEFERMNVNKDTEYTYDVYLRDSRNGKTKVYTETYPCNLDACKYYFIEGNGGCDCNRSLWIYGYENKKCLECNVNDNIILIDKIVVKETGEIFLENVDSIDY